MRIISFTMVNNEAEIIESFIRYNSNFVDEMIIIDNGCTDNTIPIIRKLITEGYKVTIFDESLEAYNQFRIDNKYIGVAIERFAPDLLIPLDADEFIIADGNPREELEKLHLDCIYYIHWQWYVMTKEDDVTEEFVPNRMQYCLKQLAWNYSDKTPVTKVILPVQYYKEQCMTMAMGHHTVFGNDQIKIEEISNIRLAHFRSISVDQLVSKTSCYTIRDISTLENNAETAQRTNQMALIEDGSNMLEAAIRASFGGYDTEIEKKKIDLSYCDDRTSVMKYGSLARIPIASLVRRTGCEMAIKYYNLERKRRERWFLKPIIMWLDGTKGSECVFPNPSNELTFLTAKANVRAYLTECEKIKFLKANYRLIITPDWVKFIPHVSIVVPNSIDIEMVKKVLIPYQLNNEQIITWKDYYSKMNFLCKAWCNIGIVTGMGKRLYAYIKRNGMQSTVRKVKERIGK